MRKEKAPIPQLAQESILIDSHCHLDMDSYREDMDSILNRARQHGVQSIITIGIDEKSSQAAIELAKTHPMLKASVGIHPHDVDRADSETLERLQTLIAGNRDQVVAYGEIGLDYAKQYSGIDIQKKLFRNQLSLARKTELPVIIHDREAHDDTLAILREEGPFPEGGVMHCFSGDMHLAEQVLELGFFISIPGVVTFKNGKELQEVAAGVPLQSLLLETDGPFLAPVPWRGKRNEPAYLAYTAQKIAELRGISIEEVADQTSRNVQKLFNYTVSA